MRRRGVELSARHQAWLYLIFGILFVSGAGWECVHYFFSSGNDLPSDSEAFWLKVHGGAAMASLIILGSVLPKHVKHAWVLKKNRKSGAVFMGLMGFMILTGYGLYYMGDESVRTWISRWHGWIGLSFPVILTVHVVMGKKSRETSESEINN